MTDESASSAPALFKMLAHDLRWQILTELAINDLRVNELVEDLHRPQNVVSYHLRQLRDGGLLRERRSSADSRDIYYHLDQDHLQAMLRASDQVLRPALVPADSRPLTRTNSIRPWRVLFLCTHNSARSQMAEGILRQRSEHRLAVFSAGSEPGEVHPLAIRVMAELGIDIRAQQSKHFRKFIDEPFHYVITVCDRMREICPVFPERPRQLHWSIPDPVEVTGTESVRSAAFRQVADELVIRIGHFLRQLHDPASTDEETWHGKNKGPVPMYRQLRPQPDG